MAQVSRRRADQLRDFMAMLIFRAVDLDHGLGTVQQGLSGGLYHARLSRPCRPEETGNFRSGGQPETARRVALVCRDDIVYRFVLSHD